MAETGYILEFMEAERKTAAKIAEAHRLALGLCESILLLLRDIIQVVPARSPRLFVYYSNQFSTTEAVLENLLCIL
jgi:GAF domain-containing protein